MFMKNLDKCMRPLAWIPNDPGRHQHPAKLAGEFKGCAADISANPGTTWGCHRAGIVYNFNRF